MNKVIEHNISAGNFNLIIKGGQNNDLACYPKTTKKNIEQFVALDVSVVDKNGNENIFSGPLNIHYNKNVVNNLYSKFDGRNHFSYMTWSDIENLVHHLDKLN